MLCYAQKVEYFLLQISLTFDPHIQHAYIGSNHKLKFKIFLKNKGILFHIQTGRANFYLEEPLNLCLILLCPEICLMLQNEHHTKCSPPSREFMSYITVTSQIYSFKLFGQKHYAKYSVYHLSLSATFSWPGHHRHPFS